ncbi:MAG: Vitamin epoxide reductase family protein [Nocardioides sp.]|nr:Vitamin epoxide reductase family protein [Nocardioides sp.]
MPHSTTEGDTAAAPGGPAGTTKAPTAAADTARSQPRSGHDPERVEGPGPGSSARVLGWLLLAGGLLGALAAGVLTVEKIALLNDSTYVPSCSLNPVLNCGSIMRTEQAEVFGFPNPLIGLAAFPVLAATGAGLLAGARYRRWYWLALQGGVTVAAAFVAWLVVQSLYRINALCPYCILVWAVVITAFWAVTAHNVRTGTFGARVAASRPGRALVTYQPVLVVATMLVVVALSLKRFWDYWVTLI